MGPMHAYERHAGNLRRQLLGREIEVASDPVAKFVGVESHEATGADEPKLSESLHRKLTAHRTKALQVLLADNAHVALASVAHVLLQQVVIEHAYRAESALTIRANDCEGALGQFADDLPGPKAATALQERLGNWRERIPGDPAKLLAWLIGQDEATLMEALAPCAATSLDAVTAGARAHPADAIAAAVGLDMADWWSATGTSYLAQVPKARDRGCRDRGSVGGGRCGTDQAQEGRGGSQSRSVSCRYALVAWPVARPLNATPRHRARGGSPP